MDTFLISKFILNIQEKFQAFVILLRLAWMAHQLPLLSMIICCTSCHNILLVAKHVHAYYQVVGTTYTKQKLLPTSILFQPWENSSMIILIFSTRLSPRGILFQNEDNDRDTSTHPIMCAVKSVPYIYTLQSFETRLIKLVNYILK